MKTGVIENERYILARNKVKKLKHFYGHLFWYAFINLFIGGTIVFRLMEGKNESLANVLSNFGVYAIWVFWGIGVFFHALKVFGYGNLFSKKWEEEKTQKLIIKEENKKVRFSKL